MLPDMPKDGTRISAEGQVGATTSDWSTFYKNCNGHGGSIAQNWRRPPIHSNNCRLWIEISWCAIPLKTTTSQDVAEALLEYFSRVGLPEEILTDRGSNFTSDLMEKLYQMLGIRGIRTSTYHPQTDGMVERYNATLTAGLKKYVDKFPNEWKKAIPYVLFACRSVIHQSTGFSQFEIIFGRQPRGPLDILKEGWVEPAECKESVISFLRQTYDRLEEAKDIAITVETKGKKKMRTWYDKKARDRTFTVGDLVLVMLPSSTNWLLAKWTGPYAVQEVLSSTTYKVAIPHARKKHRTFHVNILSRWESPSAFFLLSVGEINNAELDFPSWRVKNTPDIKPHMDSTLSQMRREDIQNAMEEYKAARGTTAGRTDHATMRIDTGPALPSSSPPYCLAHARKPIGDAKWWHHPTQPQSMGCTNGVGSKKEQNSEEFISITVSWIRSLDRTLFPFLE